MAASIRTIVSGLALALALTACSGDDPQLEPITADEPAEDGIDDEPDEPAEAEPETTAEEEVAERWVAFHALWSERAGTGEADEGTFDGVVEDPERYAGLIVGQAPEDRFVTHEVEHWTRVEVDGDQARIEDCIITLDRLEVQDEEDAAYRTTWWTATAVRDGDDWLIRSHNADPTPCVAEELNDQLLAAYQDFRDARNEAWDPPDPDHPALELTMTGDHLEFFQQLLAEHRDDGITVREPAPTDHAVVFDLEIGFAVVSDCTEQDPGFGAYDVQTGERLDEVVPPVEAGQVDLQSVELVDEDGEWKVSQQARLIDSDCEVGSTDHVVR